MIAKKTGARVTATAFAVGVGIAVAANAGSAAADSSSSDSPSSSSSTAGPAKKSASASVGRPSSTKTHGVTARTRVQPVTASPAPAISTGPSRTVPVAASRVSVIRSTATGSLLRPARVPAAPALPAAEPVSGLLAWIRREVQATLFNKTPTATPVQISQSGTGTVIGSVGAVDAEGDPLVYRVTSAPTNGTVVVDSAGNYTYTPNALRAASGGADAFTVSVRDVGFHLHLFNGTGQITTPITVSVQQNQAPGAVAAPSLASPSRLTGLVTGVLNIIDPNNNPLTYTVKTGPTKGTVVIDELGAFRYTPDPVSRNTVVGAEATDADRFDTFTVVATDGEASTAVTVTVPVAVPDGKVVATITVGTNPQGLAVSPDGSRIYVANLNGTVSAVDAVTRKVLSTFDVGNGPSGVAVSADGKSLYVTNYDSGEVSVVQTGTGDVVDVIGVGTNPDAIVLNKAGDRVYVANTNSNTVSVIGPGSVNSVAVGPNPSALALSADGSRLYVANFGDGSVSVIKTADNTADGAAISVGGNPAGIALSSDGATAYVSDFENGLVTVVDLATRTVTAEIAVGENPGALAVSPDGTTVYVANSAENTVTAIDVETRAVRGTIDVGSTPDALAFGPGGSTLYVSNTNSNDVSVISVLPQSTLLTSTRGFDLYNLSGSALKLAYWETKERPEGGGPPIGFTLEPGQSIHMEVIYNFLKDTEVRPVFVTADGPAVFYYTFMRVGPFGGTASLCNTSGSKQCNPSGNVFQDTRKLVMLDAPGTVIQYGDGQGQLQAQVLNQLCYEGSAASCKFEAKRQINTKTPVAPVGSPVINDTKSEQSYSIAVTDTKSETDSVSVTAKVAVKNIKKIVDIEISATYGHTWTLTHTFTQTINVKVPPRYESQIFAAQPVYRVYGDFTLEMGNTIWHLTDVYFDTPNPNGQGAYYITEKPFVDLS